MTVSLKNILLTSFMLIALNSCGGAGDSPSSASVSLLGAYEVRGSISTPAGANLSGWVISLVDAKTEIARTSSITTAGIFAFPKVSLSNEYTIVLLSPTLRVSAVMFQPSTVTAEYYYQNFKINTPSSGSVAVLPPLVVDGKSMAFDDDDNGIKFTSMLFNDSDGDSVADGMGQFSLTSGTLNLQRVTNSQTAFNLATNDSDTDGVIDTEDSDVDGDGVINVFDNDDDNDGLLDVFDVDSDNDTFEDYIKQTSDQFFKEGVEWIAVNYKYDVSSSRKTISFVTKVRPGVNPSAVQVMGPQSLLELSQVAYTDENDEEVTQLFNGILLDEGNDGDSSANDLIFGRTVILDTAAVLLPNTTIFIQLVFGTGVDASFVEFPYVFSLATPSAIEITVTGAGSLTSMLLSQYQPFGSYGYFLSGQAFDESGNLVWSSDSEDLGQTISTIPSAISVPTGISADTTCEFQAVARSLDKVPGYSNYTVLSEKDQFPCPN